MSLATSSHKPKRPRPAITQDIEFFFTGAKEHKLLIQKCSKCSLLRHPPLPCCPECNSFSWETIESKGLGTVYSFVVNHYPQVPAFDYPLVVGLIELDEGTRIVSQIVDCEPGEVFVGMALEVKFLECDDELTLPVFAPRK